MTFPGTVSDYWQETEEEQADLPYPARDLINEAMKHLAGGDDATVEDLLENLVHYSLGLDEPIVQAKIHLDAARIGYQIDRFDIACTNAAYAAGVLEGENPCFHRRDMMCGHVQNHYLAKCYYLLAILESRDHCNSDIALVYLQKCQDKVSNLRSNPYDHIWTGNDHYREWDATLRREIDEYTHYRRGALAGGGAPAPGSAGRPPAAPPAPAAGGATPSASLPVSGGGSPRTAGLPHLPITGVHPGPLPVMGELSIGVYTTFGADPLIPQGHAGPLKPPAGQSSVSLTGSPTSEFKIDGGRFRLYDLRRNGGPLAIDPVREPYFIVRVQKAGGPFTAQVQPGDYLLVHHRETVGVNDLIFYERYDPYDYAYKLDEYHAEELNPKTTAHGKSGDFQEEVDHAETKPYIRARGIAIGAFKRVG